MKNIFLSLILGASLVYAHTPCEEETAMEPVFPFWSYFLNGKADLNQTQFKNWQSGGEDALNWQFIFDGGIAYETEKQLWENLLTTSYGRSKIGKAASRKSLDELDATTRYTYKLDKFLNPYASVHFKSQMTTGFEYPESEEGISLPRVAVSEFMAPGYLTESVGIGSEPLDQLVIRLGGALKQTFANKKFPFADDPDTEEVETFQSEPGAELSVEYEIALNKRLQLKSKFYSFTNFEGSKHIDASLESALISQISDWFQVTLGYDVLYDRDIDKSYQTKSLISMGLQYSFL